LTTVNDAAENNWICQTFTNCGVTRTCGSGSMPMVWTVATHSYSWADGSAPSSTYRNLGFQEPNFSDQYTLIIPAPDTTLDKWNNVSDTTRRVQFFPHTSTTVFQR